MAYLKPISAPKCKCGARATVTLINRFNSPVAEYCARCGKKALEDFQRMEREHDHEQ